MLNEYFFFYKRKSKAPANAKINNKYQLLINCQKNYLKYRTNFCGYLKCVYNQGRISGRGVLGHAPVFDQKSMKIHTNAFSTTFVI